MSALFHLYLCGRKATEWLINMVDMKDETSTFVEDIRKEYDVARENCKLYFERMYKILEFSLGVMVAVIGIDFGILGGIEASAFSSYVIFLYILPACLYILGLMYAYNAYSLSVYGNETCALRKTLYDRKNYGFDELNGIMREYVKTNPLFTIISYGTCMLFYILGPLISIYFAYWRYWGNSRPKCTTAHYDCFGCIIDFIQTPCFTKGIWVLYAFYMVLLIIVIGKNLQKGRSKEKHNDVSEGKCKVDLKAAESADEVPAKVVKVTHVHIKRCCCSRCSKK